MPIPRPTRQWTKTGETFEDFRDRILNNAMEVLGNNEEFKPVSPFRKTSSSSTATSDFDATEFNVPSNEDSSSSSSLNLTNDLTSASQSKKSIHSELQHSKPIDSGSVKPTRSAAEIRTLEILLAEHRRRKAEEAKLATVKSESSKISHSQESCSEHSAEDYTGNLRSTSSLDKPSRESNKSNSDRKITKRNDKLASSCTSISTASGTLDPNRISTLESVATESEADNPSLLTSVITTSKSSSSRSQKQIVSEKSKSAASLELVATELSVSASSLNTVSESDKLLSSPSYSEGFLPESESKKAAPAPGSVVQIPTIAPTKSITSHSEKRYAKTTTKNKEHAELSKGSNSKVNSGSSTSSGDSSDLSSRKAESWTQNVHSAGSLSSRKSTSKKATSHTDNSMSSFHTSLDEKKVSGGKSNPSTNSPLSNDDFLQESKNSKKEKLSKKMEHHTTSGKRLKEKAKEFSIRHRDGSPVKQQNLSHQSTGGSVGQEKHRRRHASPSMMSSKHYASHYRGDCQNRSCCHRRGKCCCTHVLDHPVGQLVSHCVEANDIIYQHALQFADQIAKDYANKTRKQVPKLTSSTNKQESIKPNGDLKIPHQFHHHYYY